MCERERGGVLKLCVGVAVHVEVRGPSGNQFSPPTLWVLWIGLYLPHRLPGPYLMVSSFRYSVTLYKRHSQLFSESAQREEVRGLTGWVTSWPGFPM